MVGFGNYKTFYSYSLTQKACIIINHKSISPHNKVFKNLGCHFRRYLKLLKFLTLSEWHQLDLKCKYHKLSKNRLKRFSHTL